MSTRGRFTRPVARGPTPIFKKRDEAFDVSSAATNGVLLAQLQIRETGTVYAAKVGILSFPESGAAVGDFVRSDYYVDCIPNAGAAIPNLSSAIERETLNGFYVGSQLNGSLSASNFINIIPIIEKFRYRRKCDENSFVRLIARQTVVAGGDITIGYTGVFNIVIRTR